MILQSFLFLNVKFWFRTNQAILFVLIVNLLNLVYGINRIFRHNEIQYIEVDVATNCIAKLQIK